MEIVKYIAISMLFLVACGGPTSINTADVKGTIEAPDADLINGTLYSDGKQIEQAILKYEDHEVSITPTDIGFEAECKKNDEHNSSFGITMQEVDKGADYIFYKEVKDFAGKKTEGYRFLLFKKGKNKSYILNGRGKMFDPIPTKEKAQAAFKAAKTFTPED